MTLEISYVEHWLNHMSCEIMRIGLSHRIRDEFEILEGWREKSEEEKRKLLDLNLEEDWCPHISDFDFREIEFLNDFKKKFKIDLENYPEVIEEINSLLAKDCYPRNTKHLDEVTSNIIKQNKKDDLYWKETQERQRELKEMYDSIPDEDNLN